MWTLIIIFTQFNGLGDGARVVAPVAVPGFTSHAACEKAAIAARDDSWKSNNDDEQRNLKRVVGIRTRCIEIR